MGSAASSTCLVKAFTDPGPAVRGSAAYILDRMLIGGQMSADTGWTVLTALLQDPEPSVRALALGALPLYATGVAEPAAQRALQDPDPDVRAAADKALVSIKSARKLRQLSGRE
jgi:HEAT repeat protein